MARVLVVDDDPDILKFVEKVLSVNNHVVFTANDAMKAMDLLNASVYDLLITDARMPRFSGFDLAQTVKNNKKFHRMAICMLTSLREKKDFDKAIRSGVDDYIVKPIDPAVLLQKVETMFIKKPPMVKPEFEIDETNKRGAIDITTAARVTKITELGLVIRSPVSIPSGLAVTVNTPLFEQLELKTPPTMKVLSCQKLLEFDYEIHIAFVAVSESFYQKVRSWIFDQIQKKSRGAA